MVTMMLIINAYFVSLYVYFFITGLPVAQPAQPSYKLGSVFPSGINRTLAYSARAQDLRVCVEQVSGLQQSILGG